MAKLSKKSIIIALALTATVAGSYWAIQQANDSKSDSSLVDFYKVQSQDLNISVTEAGSLQAVKENIIRNHLSGNSKIVYLVPEGTKVKVGDLLVELDAAEMKESKKKLELEIETSKSSVQAAQNSLIIEKSTVDSDVRGAQKSIIFAQMDLQRFNELDKKQQLRNAETDIATAEDSFKLSEQRFDWSKKLADKGFETKSQVDRDRLDMKSKTKSLETTKSRFEMLKRFDLPKQEAELKSKLTEAKKKHERVVKQGDSKLTKAKSSLTSANRKLKLNQERLADINQRLSQVKLTAPVDGLVIHPKVDRRSRQTPIEEGATVSKNRKLVTIPDISQMKVEIQIPEFHISKIKKGQLAYVNIDSLPDQRFAGKVTKVSVLPESNSGWLSTGDKFYTAEVLVTDKLPIGVKPKVSAKVEIIVADLRDTIAVPLQAVTTEKGKHYCMVKNSKLGNETEKRLVSIGMMNNSFIQILDGLQEGDQVLLGTPFEK